MLVSIYSIEVVFDSVKYDSLLLSLQTGYWLVW